MNIAPPISRGWIVSVLFWLCLLAAVALYGSVALAPKYLEYLELRSTHRAGHARLTALERQVRTLRDVSHALEHDPAFVAEQARIVLDAGEPDEERIAVAPEHRLDASSSAAAVPLPATTLPAHAPLVRVFAENSALRRILLASAAVIVIGVFTLLHESPDSDSISDRRPFASFGDRYRDSGE